MIISCLHIRSYTDYPSFKYNHLQKKKDKKKHEINCRTICRISVSRTDHYTINNNIISRKTERRKRNIYKGKIEKERNC